MILYNFQIPFTEGDTTDQLRPAEEAIRFSRARAELHPGVGGQSRVRHYFWEVQDRQELPSQQAAPHRGEQGSNLRAFPHSLIVPSRPVSEILH